MHKKILTALLSFAVLAGNLIFLPSHATDEAPQKSSFFTDKELKKWQKVILRIDDTAEENEKFANLSVEEKIKKANLSQKEIIEELKKNPNEVRNYTPFFIINGISLEARGEFIEGLLKKFPTLGLSFDKKIKSVQPLPEDKTIIKNRNSENKHVPWNLSSIGVDKVFEKHNIKGKDVVVGIIDSGVDIEHKAVKDQFLGKDEKDLKHYWLDLGGASDKPIDSTGHGTHVLGTILGTKEDKSLLGVAPAAKWIAVRVFDEKGESDLSKLIKASQWMLAPGGDASKKPKIVNCSWSGNSENKELRNVIKSWREAGILAVFSAGNRHAFNNGGEGSIETPAAFDETLAVAALKPNDGLAKFSLRGPSSFTKKIKPDISARGVNIFSAENKGTYKILSGTSMASPHIAGVAALMLEANPNLNPEQIANILRETATPLVDDEYVKTPNFGYGHGKVNALLAVEKAKMLANGESGNLVKVTGRVLIKGSDKEEPKIEHRGLKTIYNAYGTEILAKVSDDVGLSEVAFFMKKDGEQEFAKHKMELSRGNYQSGSFVFELEPSMLPEAGQKLTYYIEATDQKGKKFKTSDFEATISTGINIGYKQDFETEIDGFDFGGKTPIWQWGEITERPKNLNLPEVKEVSGKKMMGTNLNGNYENLKTSLFVLPPLDLRENSKHAVLKFKHWHDLDNGYFAFFDTAELWIGEIPSESTKSEDIQYKNVRLYQNSSKGWKEEFVDLHEYTGKRIAIMFALRSAPFSPMKKAGWYVDEVVLDELPADKPSAPKDIELQIRTVGQLRFTWSAQKDHRISKYNLYRATKPEGPYDKILSLDKSKVGLYSPAMTDIPVPQTGTYYYYVTSAIGPNESIPSATLTHEFTKGISKFKFDFENDDQKFVSDASSWSKTDEEFKSLNPANWHRTVAEDEDPDYGMGPSKSQSKAKNTKSPHFYFTGDKFGKGRKPNSVYSLTSPKLDLSEMKKARLHFQTWYASTGRNDNDVAYLYYSLDGKNFEKFFTLDEKAIDEGIENKTRSRNYWYLEGVDIPQKALAKDVQIRFVWKTSSEGFDNIGGWYIDDVEIFDLSKFVEDSQKIPATLNFTRDSEPANMPFENLRSAAENATDEFIPSEAFVSVKETGQKVKSAKGTGKFELLLPEGKYTLLASHANFNTKELALDTKTKHDGLELKLDEYASASINFKVKNQGKYRLFRQEMNYPLVKEAEFKEGENISIPSLSSGVYTLLLSAKDKLVHEQFIVLADGQNLNLGEFTLAERSLGKEEDITSGQTTHRHASPINMKKGRMLGNKYSANTLSEIKEVKFYLLSDSSDVNAKEFSFAIYEKNNKDGLPGRRIYGPVDVNANKFSTWNSFTLDEPVQVVGDFFVAFIQKNDVSPLLATDEDMKGKNVSFKSLNDAWNEPDEIGLYMMGVKLASVNADSSAKIEKGHGEADKKPSESESGKTSDGDKSDKLPDIIYKPHEDHRPKILETRTILKDSPKLNELSGEIHTENGLAKILISKEKAGLVDASQMQVEKLILPNTESFNSSNFDIYDINLFNTKGEKITDYADGFRAEVLLPVAKGREAIGVKYFADDNMQNPRSIPSVEVEIEGQKYRKFVVSHFSAYGIEYKPMSGVKDKVPNTSAGFAFVSVFGLICGLVLVLIAGFNSKLSKN